MGLKLSRKEEEEAQNIHSKAVVVDGHSDIPIDVSRRRIWFRERKVMERVHLPKMRRGGIDANVIMVGGDDRLHVLGWLDKAVEATLRNIGLMDDEVDESSAVIAKVTTVKEIREAKRKKKFAVMYGLEGLKPIGGEVENLRILHSLGLRSALLTWNHRNLVADGVAERGGAGLSNFGIEVVREMNKLGIIVDISHINAKGFFDVLELTKSPCVASHSNAFKICQHRRNLTDEQLKALAEKGGVVGVCFFPPFVAEKNPSLEQVLDHVDYISKLIGSDRIGVGPDYSDYFEDIVMAEVQAVPELYGSKLEYTKELENAGTLRNLTRGLVSRGYSEKEILGILGENFLRVYQEILGA
jgi:membrane dipeptidase